MGLPPAAAAVLLRRNRLSGRVDLDKEVELDKLTLREHICRANALERRKLQDEQEQRSAHEAGQADDGGEKGEGDGAAAREGGAGGDGAAANGAADAPLLAPQMRLIDGQLVIDEATLSVQAQSQKVQFHRVDEESYLLNNMTYMKGPRGQRWTPDDTETFFQGLACFGTNFQVLSKLFPSRNRKQLKAKFNREYKANRSRVEAALSGHGFHRASWTDVLSTVRDELQVQAVEAAAAAEGARDHPPPALLYADGSNAAVVPPAKQPAADGAADAEGDAEDDMYYY